MDRVARTRPPVVLIVDDEDWYSRSLESVLAPRGYVVTKAHTGAAALERARVKLPDVAIVSADLPNGDGVTVCRSLREDPLFGAELPILMVSPERTSREGRLAALRAGAWDVLAYPLDAEELLLRLDGYVQAKLEGDEARSRCLVDRRTGLYNARGLEKRARELQSQAHRDHRGMACVVIAVSPRVAGEASLESTIKDLAQVLRDAGRLSDAIGRLGKSEFAVLATGTDTEGAAKMAERLLTVIQSRQAEAPSQVPFDLRAGYDAVANMWDTPIQATELIRRATTGMRRALRHSSATFDRIPFPPPGKRP